MRGRSVRVGVVVAAMLAVAGCGTTPSAPTAPLPGPTSPPPTNTAQVQPDGTPTVIASGLDAPWSVVRLANGSALISERDTALIKELTPDGEVRDVGTIAGVQPRGEGGLLGIDVLESGEGLWLYAYFTSDSDNRIVRMPVEGEAGSLSLGEASVVLSGIAKAGNHNGGRIKFGPDGMLYATSGDAGDASSSQDPESLNGKILRMTPEGAAPADNPTPGSLVYSLGHRNPQGIAWDDTGRLWAAEFGQNTWDELNVIQPSHNYGWPEVEGAAGVTGFDDPVYQWSTAEASPSGLAYVDNTFFLAALRGQALWAIYPVDTRVDAVAWFTAEYGRLRDAIPGPDGTLWVLTNNTDGRGNPVPDDDKLLEIRLVEQVTG
ncbi:PQQ-dependent sugar dehydrogenase [Homoserinimonas sp. A447]